MPKTTDNYNTDDVEQVRGRKKRHELESEQRREEFRVLLQSRAGRAVIWRILEEAGIYRQSFTGDAEHTFFNEGRRKVGLEIISWFNDLAEEGEKQFALMTSEMKSREKRINNG